MIAVKNIKNYTFVCDIKSKSIRDKIIQVDVSLRLEPLDKNSDKNVYVSVELSSIIQIEGEVKKDELEKIVLIKVPTTVYPEIRNILIFLFEKSGCNKINIDHKIDFSKLYENRKNQK